MSQPCERYEPELSAFLDGELPPAEHGAVARHVEVCSACARAVAHLQGVSGVLRRWDATETRYAQSNAFRNRVIHRIAPAATRPSVPTARLPWGSLAAAAAVVAAVSVGASWGLGLRKGSGEPLNTAEMDRLVQEAVAQALAESRAGMREPSDPRWTAPDPAGPWDPVVGTRVRTHAHDELPEGMGEVPWENRGDHLIVRDAGLEYERFRNESRDMALEEKVRSMAKPAAGNPTAAAPPPTPLSLFLSQAEISDADFPSYRKIQVWPIEMTPPNQGREAYVSTSEALRNSDLKVYEGNAPATVVFRTGDLSRPILVLAGDVISGARQDRVAAEDMLLGPNQDITAALLTSGDSRRTSYRRFTHSNGLAPAGARAFAVARLGQGQFDVSVTHALQDLSSAGRQGSLDNLFGNAELLKEADDYVRKFQARLTGPRVVGCAVAAGPELLGIEIFRNPADFQERRVQVVRSFVMESLSLSPDALDGESPDRTVVASVMASARAGVLDTAQEAGALTVREILDPATGVFGMGTSIDETVIHALVFPARRDEASPLAARGLAGRGRGGATGGRGGLPEGGADRPLGPERGDDPGRGGLTPGGGNR